MKKICFILILPLLLSINVILIAQETGLTNNTENEKIPAEDSFFLVDKEPIIDMNKLLKNVVYPMEAIKNNIHGRVIIRVYIDKTGKAKKTLVQQSDAEILNQAAIDAIMKTEYEPAVAENKPVGCWVTIPIRFLKSENEKPDTFKFIENIPKDSDFVEVEKEPSVDMDKLRKMIKYPEDAKKQGIEGRVLIRIYIDSTGTPKKTIIQESSSIMLNQAAIDAVLKTTFTPAYLKGKPIGCWVTIPIMFKLKKMSKD